MSRYVSTATSVTSLERHQSSLPFPAAISMRCSAACSRPPSSSTAWKNAGVGSQTYLVSDDAAIDARRTRSLQPPPRFTVFADRVARSRPFVNTPSHDSVYQVIVATPANPASAIRRIRDAERRSAGGKSRRHHARARVHERATVSNAIRGDGKTSSKRESRAPQGGARLDRGCVENSFFRVVELEARSEYAPERDAVELEVGVP